MKRFFVCLICVSIAWMWVATDNLARKLPAHKNPANYSIHMDHTGSDRPLDAAPLHTTAVVDTYLMAEFDFEGPGVPDPQGWFGVDKTAQLGTYFHIDNFAGLGGGSFGLLVPIEGNQSLWCGARPDTSSIILCGYAKLPGYGNLWDQRFQSVDFAASGDVTLVFKASYDSEPGYDYTYVQYENKSNDWITLLTIDDFGTLTANETVPSDSLDGSVKFRFQFISDGAWSDEDGLWNTDGAIVIDSLVVSDSSGVLDYQNFESESVGDTMTIDGDWFLKPAPSYGIYAGLFPGNGVLQEDPCIYNASFFWGFFKGSAYNYACAGHPEQPVVPYGEERDGVMLYFNNEIWSPPIDWTHDIHGTPIPSTATDTYYEFDIYRDMSVPALIYWFYHARWWRDGCPGDWKDYGFANYGADKDWYHFRVNLGGLLDPLADQVQLALTSFDMCPFWYLVYGDCSCHSHSPLFDNVKLYRLDSHGPRWSVRDIDLFQDTFPENGTSIGTGRIDMALDRAPSASPTIYPGDSLTANCSDPTLGLLEPEPHSGFGSAVYLYLSVAPQDQAGKMAPAEIEEDGFRWPVVDSVFCNGFKWYQFRMDTAFTEPGGPRTGPVPDRFCIDLNDHCFTNGDTLYFVFGAENSIGEWTYWSLDAGTVASMEEACSSPMEIQILPGAGPARGGNILYVDNFSGRGAQPYFESAFEMIGVGGLSDYIDRFDKRGPTSCVSNSLGHRCSNVFLQLIPNYSLIIWNSGNLSAGTVGDGTGDPEKADDFTALTLFLSQHTDPDGSGIYFSGDDMAEEWADPFIGPSATAFINTYIPHALVTGDHVPLHGLSPYAIGEVGGIFDVGASGVDTVIAYGGCPVLNDFDQIQPTGISTLEMTYSGTGLSADGAIIAASRLNDLGNPIGVVLSGFSYHYIRDDRPHGIPDRADHLEKIISYLVGCPCPLTGTHTTPRFTNSLSQNYPNPFNPVTTIRFSIAERSHVSLKVYNVAGQLVRTLVNEVKSPQPEGFTVRWNGKSESGDPVSSGVYFYKIVSKDFMKTKKMVLLK